MIEHPLEQTEPPQKGLGRLPSLDFGDRLFNLPPPVEMPTQRIKHYRTGPVMNQGSTSQCVAYSGEQFLVSGQVTNRMYKTPEALYEECQDNDEWPGSNYDGTSVRALGKVLKARGYLEKYLWALNVDAVVTHLANVGPVVFGTSWYNSMFEPDKEGFINVFRDSGLAGGHAYMIKGYNMDKKCPGGDRGAVRIINSWGRGWGENGFAWLSFKNANTLLSEWGEGLVSNEIKFIQSTSSFSQESEQLSQQLEE